MTICERMFSTIDRMPSKTSYGLSKTLGVGTGLVSGWKNRDTDPPAKYIAQICEYLEISMQYLLTGEETESDIDKRLQESMTEDERRVLTKYRELDDDGKDAVRGVLLQEQRRVEANRGMATDTAS